MFHLNSVHPVYHHLWNKVNAHKISMCLYLAYINKLNTLDKIKKWSNIQSDLRELCNKHEETSEYLFFACKYSSNLCQQIKQKFNQYNLQIDNIQNCMEYISSNYKMKGFETDRIDTVISVVVWHIWIERNCRLFRNTNCRWK